MPRTSSAVSQLIHRTATRRLATDPGDDLLFYRRDRPSPARHAPMQWVPPPVAEVCTLPPPPAAQRTNRKLWVGIVVLAAGAAVAAYVMTRTTEAPAPVAAVAPAAPTTIEPVPSVTEPIAQTPAIAPAPTTAPIATEPTPPASEPSPAATSETSPAATSETSIVQLALIDHAKPSKTPVRKHKAVAQRSKKPAKKLVATERARTPVAPPPKKRAPSRPSGQADDDENPL